jgi:plastocyanin
VFSSKLKESFGVILVAALAAASAACGGSGYGSTPSTNPTPTPTPAAAADVTITISGQYGAMSFSPSPASAKAGQTVSWHNADNIPHSATGTGFDTGIIAPGGTSTPIMFSAAASNDYHCSIHQSMVGTLTVTP